MGYSMALIRTTEGVDRSQDDWDDGLANFGFEAIDGLGEILLASEDKATAIAEAAHHWRELSKVPFSDLPEGFWIVPVGDSLIVHMWVDTDEETADEAAAARVA